jgi:NAD(P)-dependent dehydrogenase (short-subunit alcohol dehydrogenase family)
MEDWVTDSIDKNATQYSSLVDKVVFITGGATGIGAAMVKAFVGQKAKVAFIDIDEHASGTLINAMKAENDSAELWYRKVDVTDPETLQLAIVEASKALGSLDVLVNNVGNDARQEVENISAYDWHKCMQVNLDPAFFASQAAFKIMREHASGSIINFSSINALIGP